MAIDLMVMPLSRYWSGDFVTPAMKVSWELGAAYCIVSPNGDVREIPAHTPFGGPDAPAKRVKLIALANEYIRRLPFGIGDHAWDESSGLEPEFFRVDPDSYAHLLEEADSLMRKEIPFWARLAGKRVRNSHLASASVLFPADFENVFELDGQTIGSLFRAKEELQRGPWPEFTEPSLSLTREAMDKALELRLPLIVDM